MEQRLLQLREVLRGAAPQHLILGVQDASAIWSLTLTVSARPGIRPASSASARCTFSSASPRSSYCLSTADFVSQEASSYSPSENSEILSEIRWEASNASWSSDLIPTSADISSTILQHSAATAC